MIEHRAEVVNWSNQLLNSAERMLDNPKGYAAHEFTFMTARLLEMEVAANALNLPQLFRELKSTRRMLCKTQSLNPLKNL